VTSRLPAGWTIERVRSLAGESAVILDDPPPAVTAELPRQPGVPLRPELVIACGVLCVVKCVDDDDWLMGSFADDGSIICWGAYPSLLEALRGL
jgi:hypothetical protein